MEWLPVLLSPYKPNTFGYLPEEAVGAQITYKQWLNVFRKSTPTFTEHCLSAEHKDGKPEAGAEQFTQDFNKILDALDNDPYEEVPGYDVQPFSCIQLCIAREQCLTCAGFTDIFLTVKREEDEAALPILPSVLADLDAEKSLRDRMILAIQGVFAGNIFDLGAAASAEQYQASKARRAAAAGNGNSNGGSNGGCNSSSTEGYASNGVQTQSKSDFAMTRERLHPRPWLIDNLDLFVSRLFVSEGGVDLPEVRYKKAVLFVDNAGPDVLLGMVPFARELLRLGIEVVIAANELPSINDITAPELLALLPQIAAADSGGVIQRGLDAGRLRVVSSGNGLPVIDLSKVSPELAAECRTVSPSRLLLVLEGMGRSIETNLRAAFTCDVLNLGMVKHPEVATELGGKMYDCVCRFRKGTAGAEGEESKR